jgi:hypothetical protein
MGLEINAFRHFSDAEALAILAWAKAGFDESNRIIRVAGSGEVNVEKEWIVDRDAFWSALNWRIDRISSNSSSKRVRRTIYRFV